MQSNCGKETFRFSEVNIEDLKKDILELDKKQHLAAFRHSH